MQTYENGYKYKNNELWEKKLHDPYDYKKGLLKHLLSNKLVNSTNPILQSVIRIFDTAIIFMLSSADELRHFKNYNWKNR